MKKTILLILVALLCCGTCMAQRKGKSKKQKAELPTVVSFVSAGQEEFLLHFNGEKINKTPEKRIDIKTDKAAIGTPCYVRIVIKNPRVGSDMAWRDLNISKMGEEYLIWYNTKLDRAEIVTREEYRQKTYRKTAPNAPKPNFSPNKKMDGLQAKPNKDELPENVIVIERAKE